MTEWAKSFVKLPAGKGATLDLQLWPTIIVSVRIAAGFMYSQTIASAI